MAISMQELLGKYKLEDQPQEFQDNLKVLLERVNMIRTAYGKPMTVTSGLRSMGDQQRINPSAPKSNHIKGAAVDFADADGKLKAWVKTNIPLLEAAELWCEDFSATPTWVHFQCFPPKSGKRFFLP